MSSKARELANLGNAYSDGALSNRNLIINGAMQVAQRGTSSTANGYCALDRYETDKNEGTVTSSQESLTSGDPYDAGFRNFYRTTNTAVATTSDARRRFFQEIEAQNIANSGWNYTSTSSYITVSFWVRTSVAGDYYFDIQTRDGTNYKYTYKETLAANTWTKVTKSISGNSNLVVNNDNGSGLRVNFHQYHGTDWTGGSSINEWSAVNNTLRYPDDTNGWGTTAGATYDVTGVQLEVGDTATPFEHRSYGQELALCQRYFQSTYNEGVAPGTATSVGGIYSSTSSQNNYAAIPIQFPVKLRATPTIVTYDDVGTSGKWHYSGNDRTTVISPIGASGGRIYVDNVDVGGEGARIGGHYTADSEL